MLGGGTFNTSSHVQDVAKRVRDGISQGAYNRYPDENAAAGVRGDRRGQRKRPLGSFQTNDVVLGKQNYDVRYNVHVCKEIILHWGRNAWNGDPIEVTIGNTDYLVGCHIDITTPRDNMLWHGDVEGPHIVIEGYKEVEDDHYQNPSNDCIWLSPNDVYMIWHHQVKQGKADWPWQVTSKLAKAITDHRSELQRREERRNQGSDSDGEDFGLDLFG